jgi:hypothetical protein
MKGAVKRNISPPTGAWDKIIIVAASPVSVEPICAIRVPPNPSIIRYNVVRSSESEKRQAAAHVGRP